MFQLNTRIDFDHVAKKVDVGFIQNFLLKTKNKTVPDDFFWPDHSALFVSPRNQMLCGCCWAIAATDAISDSFVINSLVDFQPTISASIAMICYPQGQCLGGNPAALLKDIAEGGILSNRCVDYSWCSSTSCNGNSMNHFGQDFSQFLPSTCGCYFSQNRHLLYKINPSIYSFSVDMLGLEECRRMTKLHIHMFGIPIAGFIVLNNFMNGNFSKTGGVYLERFNYKLGGFRSVSESDVAGSHAVTVIGWGTQHNVLIDEHGTLASVPYWFCRNSWGSSWGEGGYFKMAMYPFNEISQFEKRIRFAGFRCGGFVVFNVSEPPKLVETRQQRTFPKHVDQPHEFYRTEHINPMNENTVSHYTATTNVSVIILIILLIVLAHHLVVVGVLHSQN
jgi:hypothetical protein